MSSQRVDDQEISTSIRNMGALTYKMQKRKSVANGIPVTDDENYKVEEIHDSQVDFKWKNPSQIGGETGSNVNVGPTAKKVPKNMMKLESLYHE